MPAANYNFNIEQGSDLKVVFQYIDENNTFVNMTNYYVSLVFISNEDQTYSFDNITPTTDYQLLTDVPGYITLYIPARVTNSYNFINAIYDLDVQEPNEAYVGSGLKRYRLAQGNIGIIKRNIPVTINNNNTVINSSPIIDACSMNCSSFYSSIYNGSSLIIKDNSTTVSTLKIQDNRTIDHVEIAINGLNHTNPQDLNIFLSAPSGDKILLSSNAKIKNYRPGFSFMLSDRAQPLSTLNNVTDGGVCRIVDKTNRVRFDNSIPISVCDESGCSKIITPLSITSDSIILGNLNNENLLSSFEHLQGYVPSSGDWSLWVTDTDTGGSGLINSWKLIITYVDIES
jgi:subtilisin-like proprotein convertase family protein